MAEQGHAQVEQRDPLVEVLLVYLQKWVQEGSNHLLAHQATAKVQTLKVQQQGQKELQE